ncbi:hypothetical protein B0H10DRAFT_2161738 [Mycena sp. CBHHK59/15]|nr:hypothetical protein B0H10DRAFT_2161738 [Mycena sp. CBHHK59/15]
MKFAYPASNEPQALTDDLLALKIARHSPCSSYHTWEVVLDDRSAEQSLVELDQYGSDDEDGQPNYLRSCACSHGVYAHGAYQAELGREEFLRRGRAAVRLDQLLQDTTNLLDFSYTDDDIESLRKQMKLPPH